jgi:hypothetical protein
MDLNTLASDLRAQAAKDSTIVLNSSVFADAVCAHIRSSFALESGKDLSIKGVKPGDIPDPSAAGVLTISTGVTSALKQTNVPVTLTFTSNDSGLQAVIAVDMGGSWNFSKSFDGLDKFPFKPLKFIEPRFVYSTIEQQSYAWPDDRSYIHLDRGLNFLSRVTFQGLPALQKLLKSDWSLELKFYGPFSPTHGQDWPVGKLRAPIVPAEPFAIGIDPIKLTMTAPAIVVEIGEATDDSPVQPIDLLVEATFQESFEVSVRVPMDGGSFDVSTRMLPTETSIDKVIEKLPGGKGFREFIPSELSTVFKEVHLDDFALIVAPDMKVNYMGLSIGTHKPWTVVKDVVLNNLSLQVETIGPGDLNWKRVHIGASARFWENIFKGDFEFNVELEQLDSWQLKTVSGAYHGSVSLGTIVAEVLGSDRSVPNILRNIQFSDFGVTASRAGTGSPFTYSFYGSAEVAFPILDTQLTSALTIAVTKAGTRSEIQFAGGLVIGEQVFAISLDLGRENSELVATWKNVGTPLGFSDIASAFGWDSMPELPEGLDLALKKVSFTYDFKNKTVVLTAESANYGEMIFASFSANEKRVHIFSLDIPLNLKFSKAPLIGESLQIDPPVGIENLQLIVASAEIEKTEDVKALESLIPKSLQKGVTFAANIEMGGPHEIVLPLTSGKKEEKLFLSGDTPATTGYKADPKWFNLKKTLGPVTFDKVGVQYQEGTLRFLLNAAFSTAGLTLSVDGLSVGSSLKKFTPEFDLRGLGIEYEAGDIKIGGAFLRTPGKKDADGNEYDSYDGAAVIKTKQVALSALGSYTKVKGEASLFIYAFLDYPLGGPSFFFVTGLAAGFGYNRRLIAPSIDNVAKFPLVQQAIRGRDAAPANVMAALESLRAYVPPSAGSIFLAIGVKFNSFKLIDSFALLTLEFGDRVSVNLIGLSTATVPTPEAGKAVTPLAQVQIAWKATFDPDEGCLAIDARLTPNSYILSKDCRLSGGFAFYSWFSGPHAGDFVQTLGGYHPEFQVPAHYPKVPRLAFDWRVSNSLTIQGDAYYALTGSALMAGGHLEVLYRQGELRAWLKVGADFLIAWKPYHYDARLYVNVGASYTFDINLLFARVRCTISVDVGAQLHLWGPDFSGTARIDLSVISFTIAFGAGASQTPEPIQLWSNFQQSFLPAENVCSVAVKDGLVRNINAGGKECWVMNPKKLALMVDSAVPFKSAAMIGRTGPGRNLVEGTTPKFGVGPMDVTTERLISGLTVTLKRGVEPVDTEFKCSVIRKKVPAGLWGESASVALNGNDFIDQIPAGIEITAHKVPEPRETAAVSVKVLSTGESFHPKNYAWGPVISFKPSKDNPQERRDEIRKSVGSSSRRSDLLKEMGVDFNINVRDKVADVFVSAPQIGTLYDK